MQCQLGANIQEKVETARHEEEAAQKLAIEVKQEQDEMLRIRAEKKSLFEKYFKCGATDVIRHLGKFYFSGDIDHCPKEDIFHNAKAIMHHMVNANKTYGHMNYNDPPKYDESPGWIEFNRERRRIDRADLYVFDENENPMPADDALCEKDFEINRDKWSRKMMLSG